MKTTCRLRRCTAQKIYDRLFVYALAIATALTASPALAQSTNTDIGTLDAQTVLPGKPPGYSPYAGRNFPSRVFWGDTHLHTSSSHGRRRLRQPARFRGSLPLRARRGTDRFRRPAGEAVAAARFPGHRRPFRQYGLLSGPPLRQARNACRPDWPEMVRYGPGGWRRGRQGGARNHRQLLARHISAGAAVPAGIRWLPLDLGPDHRRGGKIQ